MTATTCQAVVTQRRSVGVLGKGTESFRNYAAVCGADCDDGHDLCPRHLAKAAADEAKRVDWAVRTLRAAHAGHTTRPGDVAKAERIIARTVTS